MLLKVGELMQINQIRWHQTVFWHNRKIRVGSPKIHGKFPILHHYFAEILHNFFTGRIFLAIFLRKGEVVPLRQSMVLLCKAKC
jgi:hypothetical protein